MLWIAATAAAAGFVSGLCYYSIAPVVLLERFGLARNQVF